MDSSAASAVIGRLGKCDASLAGDGHNVDASSLLVKHYGAFAKSEQREVAALSDVSSWLPLGANLADKDIAGNNGLTTVLLDSTHFGERVSTVATGTLSFLVGHLYVPFAKIFLKRFDRGICERRSVTKIVNISRRF